MNYLAALKDIKAFVFDVDGVMTNSEVLVTEEGKLLRTMNVRDGYALKMAVKAGYFVGIITGGKSKGVEIRLRNLGIEAIYSGIQNKKEAIADMIATYHLDPANIAYMGDDIADLNPMRIVGIPTCPQDACNEIQQLAVYISPMNGGAGCVRDLIEKTMKIANCWPAQTEALNSSNSND